MFKTIGWKGKEVAYQAHGEEGPVVMLVHGYYEDRHMWEYYIQALSSNYHVICPDLTGFGDSEAAEETSMLSMAAALHAILLQEGIASCTLVGHSMGGYVGLAFAEQYTNMLDGLCLFHSHPFADTPEKRENRLKAIRFIEQHGSAAFAEQLIPQLFTAEFRQQEPLVYLRCKEQAAAQPQQGILQATHAMIQRPDRSKVLQQITCPVLFIIGRQDQVITEEQSLQQIDLPASSTASILDHVGHMGMFEAPEVTLGVLIAWLEGLQP